MLNRRLCTTSISYAQFMQALRELPHLMRTLLRPYERLKFYFSAKVLHFNLFFIIWGGGKKNVNKTTNEPFSTIMKKHFVSLLSKTHRFIIQRFESKIKDCYILVSYEQSIPIVVFHCFSTIGECMLPNI